MEIKPSGSQASMKGPTDWFTGNVRIDPLFPAVDPSRVSSALAMLPWGAAERPQCVLQTLRQCHKALTTEHDVSMLPAREGQTEVIEPVIQRHTGNIDAVIAHVG